MVYEAANLALYPNSLMLFAIICLNFKLHIPLEEGENLNPTGFSICNTRLRIFYHLRAYVLAPNTYISVPM